MPIKTKGKSVLMTPDPYHTPGYGGFCPQFKYRMGETFGRTTAELLTDPTVASSGRLVLAEITPGNKHQLSDQRLELIRTRTQSWGDQKLLQQMVPGYTGFVPKGQHYFGKRYAENSLKAISDFENDQRKHNQKMVNLDVTEALQSGRIQVTEDNKDRLPQIGTKYKTPLEPIAKEPAQYFSPHVHHHSMSPFYMSNDNPEKNFMSGYTGFVPHSRGLIGMGYPIITNHAVNSFTDATKNHQRVVSGPIKLERKIVPSVDTKPIYPEQSGLVPHYTGHIPGEKFRFGLTFGHSTENALAHTPNAFVSQSV